MSKSEYVTYKELLRNKERELTALLQKSVNTDAAEYIARELELVHVRLSVKR